MSKFFRRSIERFKKDLVGTLISLEAKDTVYVRRIRMLYGDGEFFIAVNKLRNRWVGVDEVAAHAERKALDRAKRWATLAFARLWATNRFSRLYIELDIREGGASFKVKDFGIGDVPRQEEFHKFVAWEGRSGSVTEQIGDFYEDPAGWVDVEIDEPGFKTLGSLHAQALRQGIQLFADKDVLKELGDPRIEHPNEPSDDSKT